MLAMRVKRALHTVRLYSAWEADYCLYKLVAVRPIGKQKRLHILP